MEQKTGRNDPCPCGSGKKYKKCCMQTPDNVLRFPGNDREKDNFKRYRVFAESWDHDKGPVPTFQQFLGTSNIATESLKGLTENIGNKSFQSLDSLSSFVERFVQESNDIPHKEFLGLSSRQMKQILFVDFPDAQKAVELSEDVDRSLVENTHFFLWTIWLLLKLYDNGNIEADEFDELPKKIIADFSRTFFQDEIDDDGNSFDSEDIGSIQLNTVLYFLFDSGYVKIRKRVINLTKKGKDLAVRGCDSYSLYKEALVWMLDSFEWMFNYNFDANQELIQNTALFGLYILHKKNKSMRNANQIFKDYHTAFSGNLPDREQTRLAFLMMFLTSFCINFGLADMMIDEEKRLFDKLLFKESELCRKLFNWHI